MQDKRIDADSQKDRAEFWHLLNSEGGRGGRGREMHVVPGSVSSTGLIGAPVIACLEALSRGVEECPWCCAST